MKANYLITLLFSCLASGSLYAQSPIWQWARTAPGTANSSISTMCTDHYNNAYVAGYFTGKLYFGNDSINDTLGPYPDVFIAKYDASGNVLWSRNGSGYGDVASVTTDAIGSVYMLGDFYTDSISFGNNVLVDPTPGPQISNTFLIKYDSSGTLIWAKNLGGINNDQAIGLCTDKSNNLYVSGGFRGDSLVLDNIVLQHLGADDGFVAKYTATGNAVWARSIGSPYLNGSVGICTDAGGNVFMTGYFSTNTLYLDSIGNTLRSPFSNNVFISKYDSLGNMQWARYAGGHNTNSPSGIAADTSGNTYVTGFFSDTIVFNNTTVTGAGYQNIFTAKYDPAGNVVWAKSAGGSYVDQSYGISAAADGDCYVTGYFQSDTFAFGHTRLINPQYIQTAFVLKYDASGNAQWAAAPYCPGGSIGVGVSYNAGSIRVAGTYQSTEILFGFEVLPASGDFFLAKLDTAVTYTGINTLNNTASQILVYPNPTPGNVYFKGVADGEVVTVYDQLGRIVYSTTANDNLVMAHLGENESGFYVYKICDKNEILLSTGKIIKQ